MNKKSPNPTVAFIGDIYLGESSHLSPAPELREIFEDVDLVVANQEGPITNCEKSIGGKCCLKSIPETAKTLQKWGIDVVSLANNHIFDYDWAGFEQTRQLLDKAGVSYFGAGKNLGDATRPFIFERKSVKIGLLAYSWELAQTTCATDDAFGCAPLEQDLMISQVHKLGQQVDSVIVIPHWGYCEYPFPAPEQVELGNRLVEGGAAAVVGHHSHVIQGVVEKNNSLVVYSLGNFAFEKYSDRGQPARMTEENRKGIILMAEFGAGRIISYDLVFTILQGNRIQVDHSKQRLQEFRELCTPLSLANYTKHWRKFVRTRMLKRIFYWANAFNWRYIRKETLTGGLSMLKGMFQRKRRQVS